VQKPRTSWTVADAAEIASEAPMSFGDCTGCDEPLGSRISTMLSQNAIRNRKNIGPVPRRHDLPLVGAT
jgi:hypothetical protein